MPLMQPLMYIGPEMSPFMIPLAGIIFGSIMVIAIVAISTITKQKLQEMEHTMQLRRMEHERRMKELDIELARLNQSAPTRQ